MKPDQPIIIVKKVKGGHGGHHGGAWKVAYADFVTAMMAFFLVMWILGLNQDTRKAIAAYFNDPSGSIKGAQGGKNLSLINLDNKGGKPSIMPSRAALAKAKIEKEMLKNAVEQIKKMVEADPRFKSLRKFVELSITREGLRIELIEAHESLFFQTGSAAMKSQTEALIREIGRKLAVLDNNIIVEGHTDSRPYAGGLRGYSNWELSTDRANSARRALVGGVRPDQIAEVRGYADSRLRTPSDPTYFANRRVSILVAYAHQLDGFPTQEVGPGTVDDISPTAPTIAAEGAAQAENH